MRRCLLFWFGLIVLAGSRAPGAEPPPLDEYFRSETAAIADRPLVGIDSAETWKQRRPELQRQLLEMLGLWPSPPKSPLRARVEGVVERPDFVIEKVLYQSMPGLYVTGNLYRPKKVEKRLPAILYVCGHGKVEKDGIIYGCKAHYQHHAAWYAANGYVCLVVDTLQLGELPGLHHGTHRFGMWWWQSRGYTPAGVEAWNGIRAIDYLVSRPEVDATRIGLTGRSGGGATSWYVAAIDDRVAAAAPVAGITDMTDHVVDGVVQGHCDCMYFTNTYRWDFGTAAALIAPRPLLVENTDHDPIFPEDGVRRIYRQLETVYGWYGARERLGLVIGHGGHIDSEEVRHPSFAFMNRWLKGETGSVVEPDRRSPIELLKVLKPGHAPSDIRNDAIHETFIAKATLPPVPTSAGAWSALRATWLDDVRRRVFGGWPGEDAVVPLDLKPAGDHGLKGARLRAFDFNAQRGVRLRLWLLTVVDPKPQAVVLNVLGEAEWPRLAKLLEVSNPASSTVPRPLQAALAGGKALAWVAPRGIGPTAWPAGKDTHIRRRFALLGQTLDGMRVWDARRALAALREVPGLEEPARTVTLAGSGQAAPVALWAAVFEPAVAGVELTELPATLREGPAFLNLERILEVPQAVALLHPRPVSLLASPSGAWDWARGLGQELTPEQPWPMIYPRSRP
jgi:dienelactone hydrolase